MTSEPAHPGGLIAALTAVGLAVAVEGVHRRRPGLVMSALGATGALLLLTKINVGVLWCAAAVVYIAPHASVLTARPWWRRSLAGAFMLMPFVLMAPLLGETWVWLWAVVFATMALIVTTVVQGEARPWLRDRDLAVGSLVAGAGLLGLVALTVAHGTSLAALVRGVLLDPLSHPVNFHLGFRWSLAAKATFAVSVLVGGTWFALPRQRPALVRLVAGLRLVGLGWLALHGTAWLSIDGVGLLIGLCLSLTPIFLLPLTPTTSLRQRGATGLVALMGMGQVLHAYPVAGSQMGWGSFLLLPLFVTGLAEAVTLFAPGRQRRWLRHAVVGGALVLGGFHLLSLGRTGWDHWHTSRPLNLPQAHHLRPPEPIRSILRILTVNTQAHAGMLYSRPGMFSFNLWADVPTPTWRNATHWFWLLTEAEQHAIIAELRRQPRSAIIVNTPLEDFIRDRLAIAIAGPLHDFIESHYRPLFGLGGYRFLVPRESTAAPFFIAQHYQHTEGFTREGLGHFVEVNFIGTGTIDAAEIRDFGPRQAPAIPLNASNSVVTLTPITSHGTFLGPETVANWPLILQGAYRLRLYHDIALPNPAENRLIYFLDDTQTPIFEAAYDTGP